MIQLTLVKEGGESTNYNIIFGLARSKNSNSTLLALQDDEYWNNISIN
jgi:hypothetical protein